MCRYTTDSVRRVVTESLLPWLVNKWERKSAGVDTDDSADRYIRSPIHWW
jgi:hypothetical protein